MASTIIIKNGTGSAVPSSLTQGELAINVNNGALFYGTSGSSNAVSSSFIFTELSASNIVTHLNITASGHISTSGNIISDKVHTNVVAGKVDGSGIVLGSSTDIHVTASGNISASGTITALSMSGDGSELTNVSVTLPSGVISSSLQDLGNITGSNITLDGNSFTMANATTPTIRLKDTTNNYFVDLKMANSFGIEVDGNANSDFYIATNEYNGTTATTTALFMDGGDGRLSLNDQKVSIDVAGNISASGTVSASVIHTPQLIGDTALSTGLLVTGEISGSQISSSGNISATGNLTVGGDLTVNGDTVTFESANADDPHIIIKNTNNSTNNGARLDFKKLRADDGTEQGLNCGEIHFTGQDSAQNTQDYAFIIGEIDVGTSGQESGQIVMGVANHDGGQATGFKITGGSQNDEIDVMLGFGAASVTTVNGNINITGSVSASGTVEGITGSFGRGDFDDVILAQDILKLNTNNKFLQGKETGGTSRNILGINSSDVIQVANTNLKTEIEGTNINLDAPVTASIISSSNFIGAPIQIVTHAWYSQTNTNDWGLGKLTNGDDNFGWADRGWDDGVNKADVDAGDAETGNFTHLDFNKGVRINHNITDIELVGTLRPNTSVTELNYYIYKGTPFNGGAGSTITFLASASSATTTNGRPNDIYITGSTGLEANKGDYLYIFANSDIAASNVMKGSYTVTAKIR